MAKRDFYNRFYKTLSSQGRDGRRRGLKLPTIIVKQSGLSLKYQKTTDYQSVEAYKDLLRASVMRNYTLLLQNLAFLKARIFIKERIF